MRSITEILELSAPLSEGFSIRIQNPPWQDLVVADVQSRGQNGSPMLWVAHCRKHGAAGFPEMIFEVERFGEAMKMTPLSLRRDMTSEQEHSAMEICGEWVVLLPVQRLLVDFANLWDEELFRRRYIDAFKKEMARQTKASS